LTEFRKTAEAYHSEIAKLEARARKLREQSEPRNLEKALREAERLDGEARNLRRDLEIAWRIYDPDYAAEVDDLERRREAEEAKRR
jgi:hypothetical protein